MEESQAQVQQAKAQPSVDEKKFHKLNPKKKPLYIATASVFLLVVMPILLYSYYIIALNRPAQSDREKTFRIYKGEGASSISSRLYEEGLINSKALFNIYVTASKNQANLQAGVYKIPAGYSVKQLVELFSNGKEDLWVTFLEGWRVEEIAQQASSKFSNISYDRFLEQARKYEGRLFPDTYEFNVDADEMVVIEAMRKNFTAKTKNVLTPEALYKVGLSEEQALILASIVEREVATDVDRAIVAGILIKRFKKGELVGADATTQYAVAPKVEKGEKVWWPKELTLEDLASESPYNTRKFTGLPPSAICSPGLGAIKAVLAPTNTDYYYYLTDSTGATHYAVTLDEHNRNIKKYL